MDVTTIELVRAREIEKQGLQPVPQALAYQRSLQQGFLTVQERLKLEAAANQ